MTLLISEKHRAAQKEIHARRPEYGAAGHQFGQTVLEIAQSLGTKDVLDYGAGKQSLAKSVPFLNIRSYDPAVDGISEHPDAGDIVVCTHVLPFVEKDKIHAVVKDLRTLTRKALIAVIGTKKSDKLLDSGESVTQVEWSTITWLATLTEQFDLLTFNRINEHEFISVWLPRL